MTPLPGPVPPSVATEADKLRGEFDARAVGREDLFFVFQILDARGDATHTSPPLQGLSALKRYVYAFNVSTGTLKWKMRLVLSWTYDGQTITSSVTWSIDTSAVTPKGRGARVVANGASKSVTDAALKMRVRLAGHFKRSSPNTSGFSSSRPIRPNESETLTLNEIRWLKSSWTGNYSLFPASPTYVTYSRTWTGVRTPGFGGLGAKRLPVNPHTVSLRRLIQGPSIFASYNIANGSEAGILCLHTKYYSGATQPTHLDSAGFTALQRLIQAASGDSQNLAETVATLGQTRDMMIGNIRRITGSLRALRKGNIPKAVSELWGNKNPRYRRRGGPKRGADTASNWLELQYGWKPLINDIAWGLKKVAEVDFSDLQVMRSAGSAKKKSVVTTDVPLALAGPVDKAGTKTVTVHTTTRYIVYWKLSSPLISLLGQAGFTNPVSLAWELLPFSFVADWFLPVGPFLEQLSAWDGVTFLGGSKTQFTRQWTDIDLNYHRTAPFNANSREWGTSSYHDSWVILDRVKLNSWPSPTLPSLKNGLASFSHVANSVALLRAVFK